ncbi:SigE family RNA polymerase sigma factor [Rugosimonospora acidiphila]|uniref:SigE family RNA polymerase sigma factor n=1 Tax=Rugosimonospora acidiphila TaxID=556531 RepID=A0ABP9S6Q5_9ACTN
MDRALEDEFEAFVRGSYTRLLRLAYLLCGDAGHAEDAVQVTLAKTALAWPRLTRSDGVDRYVRRALINTVIAKRRRRWWSETPTHDVDHADSWDEFGRLDERDALRRALAGLPARQRAAVVLRYYEDLSEAQAAEVLGCSVGNVKSLTARGLQRLREIHRPPGIRELSNAATTNAGEA